MSGHARRSNGAAPQRKPKVKLPHAWKPYPWQADVLRELQKGRKRFFVVVHRRAGKDQVALNVAAIASQMRVGQYWHILPYASQSKTNIWNGRDKHTGIRFIDQAFPDAMRAAPARDNMMEIDLANGSQFKILGSDNFNAFRSGNPLLVTLSEAAFAHREAWHALSPILRENGGIAFFISTPNGRNWFHDMYQSIKDNPEWYVVHLTVDDTRDWNGNPLTTEEDIQAERDEGKPEEYIRREFYCDFNASVSGAYYQKELILMNAEGRIRQVDYDPKRPVTCAFDLGFSDELVAGFFQKKGNAHYMIGSRAWQYTEMTDALDEIQVTFPWTVSKYVLPHDASSRTTRQLLLSAFEKYGEAVVVDRGRVHAGIQVVRELFPTLWIDNAKRDWGDPHNNTTFIDAIGTYRSKEKDGVASASPVHDWSSHYMDMLRYYALADVHGLTSSTGWGPGPNYAIQDRIARTTA